MLLNEVGRFPQIIVLGLVIKSLCFKFVRSGGGSFGCESSGAQGAPKSFATAGHRFAHRMAYKGEHRLTALDKTLDELVRLQLLWIQPMGRQHLVQVTVVPS